MHEVIASFNKQFLYKPEIVNLSALSKKRAFVVIGMGGSTHAPKLLKLCKPELDIMIRTDYGLPEIPLEQLKNKLIILSSYSGNTEEVIDAFHKAKSQKLDIAVIAVGGKLLALAKENKVPYIQLPDTGIQPRSAMGFSMKAFLKITGEESELKKLSELAVKLNPTEYEEAGKKLAKKLENYIPVIYASNQNMALAENWKIKINENGKIPSFYNVFPELNHNEMTGFDAQGPTKDLNSKFCFIFLRDKNDNPKILTRMEVTEKLYQERNIPVEIIEMQGVNTWHKIFSSLVLADWTSYHTALLYGVEPEKVPMVEEFKKMILG